MDTNVTLTDNDMALIENALNAYWHEAENMLFEYNTRHNLGDIERKQLIWRKQLILDLLHKLKLLP